MSSAWLGVTSLSMAAAPCLGMRYERSVNYNAFPDSFILSRVSRTSCMRFCAERTGFPELSVSGHTRLASDSGTDTGMHGLSGFPFKDLQRGDERQSTPGSEASGRWGRDPLLPRFFPGVGRKVRYAWDYDWLENHQKNDSISHMGKVTLARLGAEGNIDQPPCLRCWPALRRLNPWRQLGMRGS